MLNPLIIFLLFGGGKLKTESFNSGVAWVCPAGVTNLVAASGYGARGTDSYQDYVQRYSSNYQRVYHLRDGGTTTVNDGGETNLPGPTPANYTSEYTYLPADPNYEYYYTIGTFTNTSYFSGTTPATTGAPTTAFGKTFPGSYTNIAQTTTTFNDVAVIPGQSYSITVPSGGSLTISYF